MALDDDIRLLSRVALFQGMSEDQVRLIAFGADRRKFEAGTAVFQEGSPANCSFVVSGGTIELFRKREDEERILRTARQGDILSELAMISNTRRLTSARAVDAAQTIRITRPVFLKLLEEYPDLAVDLHRRISQSFSRMAQDVGSLSPRFAEDLPGNEEE